MKLRDKLKRFRERAGEHFTILRCPECGEEIWGTGDIAMKVLVAEWAKGVGQERDPDPFVERSPRASTRGSPRRSFSRSSGGVCLKDGTRVTVRPGERFEAFCAEMAGEEHPLLDRIPQIGPEASPGVREMVEVFVAFRGDDEG